MWTYTYSIQFISGIIISVNYPNNMNSVKAVFLSCDKMILSVTLLLIHHILKQLNSFTRVRNQHQCIVSPHTRDMRSSQNKLFLPCISYHTPIIKGLSKLDLCHVNQWPIKQIIFPPIHIDKSKHLTLAHVFLGLFLHTIQVLKWLL